MRSQLPRTQPPRTLPARPSLRHLKLEAKRRLAAGAFATLHDAQTAIAREHGLSSWPRLKQACTSGSPALAHLLWVAERFSGAGRPGWTAPGEDELRQHFDDQFLAAIMPGTLAEQASQAGLRGELVVISQAPLEAQVELAGLRLMAAADAAPPHRLTGLRGFPLGDRVTDPPGEGSDAGPDPRRPPGRDRRGRRPGPRRAGRARPAPGGRRPRPRVLDRRHRACRPGPVGAAAARQPVPGARACCRPRGTAASAGSRCWRRRSR